jgi:hypothetical protein
MLQVTLVVARKKGNVISLVSDTGISLNDEQLGFEQQLPKLCILNDKLALGFSGSPEMALRVINGAPKHEGATYGEVARHFLDAHRQFDQGLDFILAFGQPLSKLARISGGEVK